MTDADATPLLRHSVATLAYRAAKVLRDFPLEATQARVAPATRTALEVLSHLADLMHWAEGLARGENHWSPEASADWKAAGERFFRGLSAVDAALAERPLAAPAAERIFQGPIADAFTHVGQLALLRGMLGSAVRPESYQRAEITVGRVGRQQAAPRAEFDGDASVLPRRAGD